jgi:hypothetical protein
MALLSTPDRFPALDGLGGAIAAFARVPDDAADEARVGGGDAVVTVQVELGESRDVDAERLPADARRDEARVHAVDAFQDDRLPVLQADHFSLLPSSGLEVITRQLDILSADEELQMSGKQRQVERIDGFEIRFAIFAQGSRIAVKEIVVQLKREW